MCFSSMHGKNGEKMRGGQANILWKLTTCLHFGVDKAHACRYNKICSRGSAGIGRQARLRGVCASVWVQVPSAAPNQNNPNLSPIRDGFGLFLRGMRARNPAILPSICAFLAAKRWGTFPSIPERGCCADRFCVTQHPVARHSLLRQCAP